MSRFLNREVLGGGQVPSNGAPTPTPSPSLTLSPALSFPEGNSGTVAFVWTLTLARNGSGAAVAYDWSVAGSGGNPADAADFGGSFPTGSGTFAPGETVKTITVLVVGDTAVEPVETFTLSVGGPGLATVTATGTIAADDVLAPPAWTVPPSISGTNLVGSPLTLSDGTHTGTVYQIEWFLDGDLIDNEAGHTLIPTLPGSYTATLYAANSDGIATATAAGVIVVTALTIDNLPPAAIQGTNYSFTFAASGGAGAITWALSGTPLPAGFSLNPNSGTLEASGHMAGKASGVVITATRGDQSVSRSFNLTVFPVFVTSNYTFDEADQTPLGRPAGQAGATAVDSTGAAGNWQYANPSNNNNINAIVVDGTNHYLRKLATTTGSPGYPVYLEKGAGAKLQRISFTGGSGTSAVMVFGSVGPTGLWTAYQLRRNTATQWRLYKGIDALGQTATQLDVGTITSGALLELQGRVLESGSVELIVKVDGVTVHTSVDSSSPITTGRIGLCGLTTASSAMAYDNIVTYAAQFVGGTGVVESRTVRMGRRTLKNCGSLQATNPALGLLVSGAVGFWSFQRSGGDASATYFPDIVENGNTPAPYLDLDNTQFGKTAVYDIYADGVSTGAKYTIQVQSAVEALDACSIASPGDVKRIYDAHTNLGGRIVEVMDAARSVFTVASPLSFAFAAGGNNRALTTHSGRIKLRPEPGSTSWVERMNVSGCARIDVEGFRLRAHFATPVEVDGDYHIKGSSPPVDSVRHNEQDTNLLEATDVSDVTITGNTIGAPAPGVPTDASQWYSGISISGTNTTVSNNVLRRVKRGVRHGNFNNCVVQDNLIEIHSSDAMAYSAATEALDLLIRRNTVRLGVKNPADPLDHTDNCQVGIHTTQTDWYRVRIEDNDFLTLPTQVVDFQGPFVNDIAASGNTSPGKDGNPRPLLAPSNQGQRLSGYQVFDCTFIGNLNYLGHASATVFDRGSWTVERNTWMLPKGQALTIAPIEGQIRGFQKSLADAPGTTYYSTGAFRYNASHVDQPSGGQWTASDNLNYRSVTPAGLSLTIPVDQAKRTAYYAPFFQDPGNDDPLVAARPVNNGAVRYPGCLFPDGSRNDGSIYAGA